MCRRKQQAESDRCVHGLSWSEVLGGDALQPDSVRLRQRRHVSYNICGAVWKFGRKEECVSDSVWRMMYHGRLFGLALVVTSTIVLTTLYYMNQDVKLTNIMEKQRSRPMMETEQQSLPDDNPDLVFLRKFGRVNNLPTAEEMTNMTDKEIQYIYHSFLDNTDFRCKRKIRMGNTGDGGWEVCDDFLYRPIKPCVVYSFGINYDFSFDDDVGKVYGCTVHAFDPSMKQVTQKRSDKVFFYNLGICGKGGKLGNSMIHSTSRKDWNLKTLTDIKTMLHHQNTTLDIVKMDIERAEWAALEDILLQGELSKVRQLLIEFHYDFQPATVRKILPILQRVEAEGLRRYHTHMNPEGTVSTKVFPVGRKMCYEIYFVNVHLARKSSLHDEKE